MQFWGSPRFGHTHIDIQVSPYIYNYIYIEREHHFPYAISQDISLCKISEYLKYLDKQTISLVLSRIFIETCK